MNHFAEKMLLDNWNKRKHLTTILLPVFLCCAIAPTIPPAQSAPLVNTANTANTNRAENIRQRIERLQAAIAAHKDQIATQEIVIHFKEGVMDLHTESREINGEKFKGGSTVTMSQIPRPGTSPRSFRDLPTTLIHPLHRLPNQFDQKQQEESGETDSSLSIEGVGKTVFRLLRAEKFEGNTYDVVEFVQHPPTTSTAQETSENSTESGLQELVCTKIVCKLYIGSDGLIRRKTGALSYRVVETKPVSGKSAPKSREQLATFESTRIEYRDPPAK